MATRACVMAWIAVIAPACGDSDQSPSMASDPTMPTIDSEPAAVTNQSHAVFSFHADGVDGFTCALDGALAACTSPAAFDIADGMHVFAVGSGGRDAVDDTFATYSWLVDTVPPNTHIDHAPPALDNSVTETLVFSGTDAVSFECALDGASFAACTSPMSVTPGDGGHAFAVRAIDRAGNTDPTPASATWTLDTIMIDTTITDGPDDGTTTVAAVSFGFSSPIAPATFECSLDIAAFAACTSPVALVLGGGAHQFSVRAKDSHGAVDPSPATRAFTVDATAPVVTLLSHPGNPSNNSSPSFTFTADDATATFECRVDAGAFAACTSPFSTALPDGAHEFAVRASDPVGNISTIVAFDWTIDSMAPGVTITSGPNGPTNQRTPVFEFTTTGSPTTVTCKLDSGAAVACTSPFTAPALPDGPHELVVTATDGTGNKGSDSRLFSVDTTAPTVVFDSKPASLWPVPYFDFTFHANDATATLECSLNGAAFAPCTSPTTINGASGSEQFSVRATDAIGNIGTAVTASWFYARSPVLAVTFDGGSTADSSTLATVPGYSPPASVATVTAVGGRSGIAARSPSYRYTGSKRALSTAPAHQMIASIWIRPHLADGGVIWSNATATDGLTLSWVASGVRLSLLHGGVEQHLDVAAVLDEWHLVVVGTHNGAADGAELVIDTVSAGIVGSGSGTTGFDDLQADDLAVGPLAGVDIDDLQITPFVTLPTTICSLGGGEFNSGTGSCTNLARPAYELSFEGDFVDSGFFHLPVDLPESFQFFAGFLGSLLRLSAPASDFSMSGFGTKASALTERTFTFLFDPSSSSPDDVLLDFQSASATPWGGRVTYIKSQTALQFSFVTTTGDAKQATVTTGLGRHAVAIVEHVAAGATASVDIFVDSTTPATTLVFASGSLITTGNDRLGLPSNAGTVIDEVRLWPRDLSTSTATLCRLGFGGRFAGTTCTLP